jgi:hypothetical protein
LSALATIVFLTWTISLGLALYLDMWCRYVKASDRVEKLSRAAARVHQELWLFAPPGVLFAAVRDWHDQPWMLFFDALSLFNWWHFRNWPEDNHWKRRGKKAKEAVERRAGRLVVVPVGASS